MNWRSATWTVIDTETTGTDPAIHRIVEVAAVRVVSGEVVARFSSLVDPGVPIPTEATDVHGITQAMVGGGPDFVEAIAKLYDFVDASGDTAIVAYNGKFDRAMLIAEFLRAGMVPPAFCLGGDEHQWIDACTWAKARDPYAGGKGRYKLTSVAARLGVEVSQAHRALGDCETTACVLAKLAESELHEDTRLSRMPDLLSDLILHQRRLRAEFDADFLGFLAGKREEERRAANA